MSKKFRSYMPQQPMLLPEDLSKWLPEGHLALFVSDVVDSLDLSALLRVYESGDGRGQPPYHPRMLTKLLVYGYCRGVFSSRRMERATYEDVGFRMLACNSHPDHDTIAAFRERHLEALAAFFGQVLALCERAGLVKLGEVALDGTKIKANASKHKAMSYGRMEAKEKQLQAEVERLLEAARRLDQAEDAQYGPGQRGDELPEELKRRESRLKKIRAAKAELEAEARAAAQQKALVAQAKIEERERQANASGQAPRGRAPQVPDVDGAKPEAKAQRNFTDPESRIMKDGASKSFEQAYNAQAVVDRHAQIIVAAELTQEANDKQQLAPMLAQTQVNMGRLPEVALADSGYWSEAAVTDARVAGVELYVAVDGQHPDEDPQDGVVDYVAGAIATALGHLGGAASGALNQAPGEVACAVSPDLPMDLPSASPGTTESRGVTGKNNDQAVPQPTCQEQMQDKLMTAPGHDLYALRKEIVEPVFGQIKEARGFRRFSLRGYKKTSGEWKLVCLTHNLLKLYRVSESARPARPARPAPLRRPEAATLGLGAALGAGGSSFSWLRACFRSLHRLAAPLPSIFQAFAAPACSLG